MVAPFLPFLLESIVLLGFAKWREEFGRWIFQTLIVTAGFLAAATRHPRRVIYNHDISQILMGRYVLFMAIPFLILFYFAIDLYAKKATRRGLKKDVWLLVASFVLVLLSYFIVVDPKIIQVEP
jgi:cytochrome bd-type quinol oxidase subunit 2